VCGIVDANVIHEVFGSDPSHAGAAFFDWADSRGGSLVSSGRHSDELTLHAYKQWARVAQMPS